METIVAKATDGEPALSMTIAVGYLRMTKDTMERAHRLLSIAYQNQVTYCRLGYKYGLSYRSIADVLGLTEEQVRQMVAQD